MKMPSAWVTATVKKEIESDTTDTPAAVTARIDMSPEIVGKGLCPECKKPMTIAHAGPSKSWVCIADRVSLPMPNDA